MKFSTVEQPDLLQQLVEIEIADMVILVLIYNILANNPVIQGAFILVVADSYKLQQEIALRLREMFDGLDMLETSETFELFQICKRSGYQSQSLLKLLENCREQLGNLLSDLPLPQSTGFVSEFEMKKVEDSLVVNYYCYYYSALEYNSISCNSCC
jgi:hypothetical protein